jgi:hypothetical protein
MSQLTSVSVQDFMKSNNYSNVVPMIRENSNGYPYITFIKNVEGKNVGENIYFSKKGSAIVTSGEVISKGFFNPFKVATVTNAAGESRVKLITQGESTWLSVDDLF